jgi:hypothetical protein
VVLYTGYIGGWVPLGLRKAGTEEYMACAHITPRGVVYDNGAHVSFAANYCNANLYHTLRNQGFLKLTFVTIRSQMISLGGSYARHVE